jgi:hypothetical protein
MKELQKIEKKTLSEKKVKESEDRIIKMLNRAIPGTGAIDNCKYLEDCMDMQIRKCGDIKKVCIMCLEDGNVIGGLAFTFGLKFGKDFNDKKPIIMYRFGQSDNYMTAIEGKGFDDIIKKFEENPAIEEITKRTKFINDEKKESEDLATIEAFKRSDATILVTRRNRQGEYEELDKKLIDVAKEKEKETGIKIKIIDRSEISKNVYLLGIDNKELVKELEIEVEAMCEVDERLFILVNPGNYKGNYEGVLAINSMEDDVVGNNKEKDRLKEYFMNKYGAGLTFICNDIF